MPDPETRIPLRFIQATHKYQNPINEVELRPLNIASTMTDPYTTVASLKDLKTSKLMCVKPRGFRISLVYSGAIALWNLINMTRLPKPPTAYAKD